MRTAGAGTGRFLSVPGGGASHSRFTFTNAASAAESGEAVALGEALALDDALALLLVSQ
jgi:hypothetical protein